ncbi:hypothetical protein ACIBSW_16210 [Actinoplanes sp. NPDC049668]|uniref:hypothetical protein n=1 Tax=unclassified Actinoplanes TaxID=2626549 RepID=UPI0033A46239
MTSRRWDPTAAAAAAITAVMMVLYLALIGRQGGQPAAWFVAGLATATLLSLYGVRRAAPRRRVALAASAVLLLVFGVLGLLSIGLPIVVAGVLAAVAAARDRGSITPAGSPAAGPGPRGDAGRG